MMEISQSNGIELRKVKGQLCYQNFDRFDKFDDFYIENQ